ncbi:hypothetical protein BCR34DRAFT_601535 [Clohesyomyces aquaticus]|uniref:Uncharacterized protein n=1 Tax=Clohesyomyces aquaticus TaxID=1231657 RepID=A0A1Y1ZM02_9PLEO|nr:hypothetical protein BCR34DRAFT_601535 [Clohesyomyces aquaticus]
MVDPASVAGFISLSLQVVQGLERYYSQFVSFHDEIKGINTRIEGLHAILHDFEQSIGRFDLREDAIWGKVQACLTACRASLKDLEAYQRRCSEPRYDPGTLTRRLELGKLRLLYPFKKETLGGLHAVLDRLVENLQTALQVLQCNTMITLHDQAEVRDKRTHHQLSHVRQNQSYQTKLLETIKDRLGASENRVQELFGSQATRISALERQLALLIPMVGQLQTRKDEWPPPLLLRNEAGGDKSLADHSIYYPYKVHRQYGESQMFEAYGLVPIYCSCSTPPQKLNCTPSRGTVSFYWTERFKHAPSCPKFLPSQWIIHAGIRFAARFWRLGYLLEARLVWSTRSIAAHVECQRLVPNNAPAFRLVYMLLQMCATPGNHLALGRALPLTLCCLIQLFKDKRASPNDVNTYGQTFFHIVVRPMALGMGEDALTMSDSAEAVNSFLRILIEMGLDLNAKDDKGL